MLTDPEVRRVLAAVMAYDNRKPGEANVAAWAEAARRGRWTYPEALDAVHAHYAERSEWLMPGMVTAHIRAARQDRAMRQPERRPDALGQARVRELTAGAFRALGAGGTPAADVAVRERRHHALDRACSYCAAQPGQPCTRRGLARRVRLATFHPSRLEAS